jgi:Bacterial membrane protein YfhO
MRSEGAPSNRGAERRATVLGGVALALVAAFAFWPVVSGVRSFFHWDLRYEIVPLWHVSQEAVHSGRMPYWIDGQYCGHPALLRQEVALFYPLTLPLLATDAPPHRLADLFSLFHFWLAGFATYLLLRDLGADFVSAQFAGVAWMLSARMVQSAIWPNAVAVSALLPLLLVGCIRIGRGLRRSGVLVTAVSGGLSLLVFRPQVLVGAVPIVAAGVAVTFALARSRRRAFTDLVLAGLLALAVGAAALLPAALLFPLSTRAGGLELVARDPRPITLDLDQVFLPVDGLTRWPEAAAYPGVAAGVLFLVGLALTLHRRSSFPRAVFAMIATGGIVGLVFAFGEAGPYRLLGDIPILRSFRLPARFLVSWSLAVAVGSGLALSHVLARTRRPLFVGGALLLVLSCDLAWHARRAAPTSLSELYTTEPAILTLLRGRLSIDETGFPQRYWSLTRPVSLSRYPDRERIRAARWLEPLSFGLGMRYGLESVQGQPAPAPTLRAPQLLLQAPTSRAAELAGAACIIRWSENLPRLSDPPRLVPPRLILQSFVPLPRALVVPEAISVPPSRAIAAVLEPSFDPRRAAVVEAEPLAPQRGWEQSSASVRLVHREPGKIDLLAKLPAEGILVLHQSYEEGWSAAVDGRPTAVFRANGAFLGVRLARGEHVVRFEYHPRGLREGLGLTAVGVLGLILLALRLPTQDASQREDAG